MKILAPAYEKLSLKVAALNKTAISVRRDYLVRDINSENTKRRNLMVAVTDIFEDLVKTGRITGHLVAAEGKDHRHRVEFTLVPGVVLSGAV